MKQGHVAHTSKAVKVMIHIVFAEEQKIIRMSDFQESGFLFGILMFNSNQTGGGGALPPPLVF